MGFKLKDGEEFTIIFDEILSEHPFKSVPVIVYNVDVFGVAITLFPNEELRPIEGDQTYESAPKTFKEIDSPWQIVDELVLIFKIGKGLTAMFIVSHEIKD